MRRVGPSLRELLQNGLDKACPNSNAPDAPPIRHANIRGLGYYPLTHGMPVKEPG